MNKSLILLRLYSKYFISILLFLLWFGKARGDGWRWSYLSDISMVWDSNVFELVSDSASDGSEKLLMDLKGRGRLFGSILAALKYRGAWESYNRYPAENRLINDLICKIEIPLKKRITIGIRSQGRNKLFPQAKRGYIFIQQTPFFRYIFQNGLHFSIFYSYLDFDYKMGSYFDYRQHKVGALMELALWPDAIWNFQISMGYTYYNRDAKELIKYSQLVYEWVDLDKKQSDRLYGFSTSLDFFKYIFLKVQLGYYKNVSNSYGYSFDCTELDFIASKQLPWSLIVRLLVNLQFKSYVDFTKLFYLPIQISPETEIEKDNIFLVDIIKDIKDNYSIRLRYALYKNESIFWNLYYIKKIFSIGFTYNL